MKISIFISGHILLWPAPILNYPYRDSGQGAKVSKLLRILRISRPVRHSATIRQTYARKVSYVVVWFSLWEKKEVLKISFPNVPTIYKEIH